MTTNGNSAHRTAPAPAPATRTATDWHSVFLVTLAATGNVSAACRAADVPRRTAYDQKESNEEFRVVWDMAVAAAVDDIVGMMFRVAAEGNVQAGHIILKAHLHEYRDNQPIVQVNNYAMIEGVPAVQALMASIDAVRDRQQAHEVKELPEGA